MQGAGLILRQQDYQGQIPTGVGQLQQGAVGIRCHVENAGLAHHVHRHFFIGAYLERIFGRGPGFKGQGPQSFKIDGVGQHQTGIGRQIIILEQFFNLFIRLVFHPAVNGQPGGFGSPDKIHLVKAACVKFIQQADVVLVQRIVVLQPDGVGQMQGIGFIFGLQRRKQRRKFAVEGFPVGAKMQGRRHLPRRIFPGAGIGHAQGRGHAQRRIDNVFLGISLVQLLQHLEGKLVISCSQLRDWSWVRDCGPCRHR